MGCRMVSLRERCAFHEAGHATAALAYGIPIVAVTIAAETPHLHRAHYRARHDLGLETLVTLCLAGPAAEELFCGAITDGSDQGDLKMARKYIARSISNPLRAAGELSRLRDAAQRLVRSAWAQHRIRLLADALLRHGTLTADDVAALLDGSTEFAVLGAVT
jgi:hypothetical protein